MLLVFAHWFWASGLVCLECEVDDCVLELFDWLGKFEGDNLFACLRLTEAASDEPQCVLFPYY